MKITFRTALATLLLAVPLCLPAAAALRSQNEPASQPQTTASGTSGSSEKSGSKTGDEEPNNLFRHAGPVRAIANALHIDIEVAAQIFEDVNSAILIFVILYFLFKTVPKALRGRAATIQKQLVEARSATEMANERLTAVEAKLARLGEDIDAIRQQTERDIVEDEKRIKQSLEDERQRIIKSAEQEIESAGAAAQRELKRFAAELSIDQAAKRIQLTAESDRALVEHFGRELVQSLSGKSGKGGRN